MNDLMVAPNEWNGDVGYVEYEGRKQFPLEIGRSTVLSFSMIPLLLVVLSPWEDFGVPIRAGE